MGLAGVKTSWQRQTRYFGHDRRDQYSVLILDNRGMGDSGKPLGRYSTSMMAADVLEVLDHVGWGSSSSTTSDEQQQEQQEQQVHLVGISLGGMIAQEVACAAPRRLRSLSLLCTSAQVRNATSYAESAAEMLSFLRPKSTELAIRDTAEKIFAGDFLRAPDAETDAPVPGVTPSCAAPVAPVATAPEEAETGTKNEEGGFDPAARFGCNFQRFQAQELRKRLAPGQFTVPGFLSQLVAAGWHRKSDAQLRAMADAVGRERIMVVHGAADRMIVPSNGERLIEVIEPGTSFVVEGMGHVPLMERQRWFNETLEEKLQAWSKA